MSDDMKRVAVMFALWIMSMIFAFFLGGAAAQSYYEVICVNKGIAEWETTETGRWRFTWK